MDSVALWGVFSNAVGEVAEDERGECRVRVAVCRTLTTGTSTEIVISWRRSAGSAEEH